MPNVPLFPDFEHWRQRAKKARVLAEQMSDEKSKKMMLRIAEDYDDLAVRAATRLDEDEGELIAPTFGILWFEKSVRRNAN